MVNYGSAGALRAGLAGLHRVTRFLQRDMDVRALGFALAKICQQKAIDFHCFKFISDNADGDAAHDWSQQLAIGAKLFCAEILQQ